MQIVQSFLFGDADQHIDQPQGFVVAMADKLDRRDGPALFLAHPRTKVGRVLRGKWVRFDPRGRPDTAGVDLEHDFYFGRTPVKKGRELAHPLRKEIAELELIGAKVKEPFQRDQVVFMGVVDGHDVPGSRPTGLSQ